MLVPMLMNLGNAPGASNTGTVVSPPSSSNGTFLMLGAGTCLALLLLVLI